MTKLSREPLVHFILLGALLFAGHLLWQRHVTKADHTIIVTAEEMEQTINTLDMNGNNYIDYTEFLAASMDQKIFMKEENLRHAFGYFDKVRKADLLRTRTD